MSSDSSPALPTILVVDDDVADAQLTKRLLLKAGVRNAILTLHNAEEAMEHLRGALSKGPKPCLVFVDIGMPKINGFEFVVWTRRQESLADIRLVILTSSERPADQTRAMSLGADGYLVKLPGVAALRELLKRLIG